MAEMRLLLYVIIIGLIFNTFNIVNSQSSPYRLPTTISPISYNLTLHPHLFDEFTFDGWLNIKINISIQHIKNNTLSNDFYIQLNKGTDVTIHNVTLNMISLNDTSSFKLY